MTTAPTGITVIPGYRVVAHFVRQAQAAARGQALPVERPRPDRPAPASPAGPAGSPIVPPTPRDAALGSLERQVGGYVRHTLAGLHASYAETGVHWAVTQLGDPDLDALGAALREAEASDPKGAVEETLRRAAATLPRPDLSAKVVLLPGDGASRVLTKTMRGAMGISLGSQATLLLFWPSGRPDEGRGRARPLSARWLEAVSFTVAHEYVHLVRNHLFPRSIAGGRPVYTKTGEPETLLDAMVAEGMADVFARTLFPDWTPPWLDGLDVASLRGLWPRIARRLSVADPSEVRRFIYGDGDRIPQWAGYQVGYLVCRGYLEGHPEARPAALVGLQATAIFRGADLAETLGRMG